MSSESFWGAKFASLRYLVALLGYGWMRLVVLLPFRLQLALGSALGRAFGLVPSRRRIAARNIAVCLPELSPEAQAQVLERHFESMGLSLMEMGMGWFGRPERIRERVRVEGAEHLEAALTKGRGVILFAAHFTTIEFFWPALRELCPKLCGMYKWQRNPVMNRMMTQGRGRCFDVMISKDNVREMMRCLRDNGVVWYAADQSYGGKSSVLLPFFGEPAMTNTAIGRIAKAAGTTVLPYGCRRVDPDQYVMTIGAPLAGLPSGDEVADTRRLMQVIESYIRRSPDQYWWIHQRFKGRPAPLPDLYARPTS
jgi:KDO2-lipid IV(A) lauroyltransferase